MSTTVASSHLTRRKPATCGWCGREVPANPTGRRRKYCNQSCRQRAYEQRAKLKGADLPEDAVVVPPGKVDLLRDQLFELRCAAEDIATAVDGGEDAASISQLTSELLDIARRVESFRLQD